MAHIILDRVGLTFDVAPPGGSLRRLLRRALLRQPEPESTKVQSLCDVSLTIHEGQRVGIVGRNGAGKTTLLKVLADIYPPTSGTRDVAGTICSLFDITLGFEVDATGRENIAYRSYLQGEKPHTLRAKLDSIVEFCELGHFLDMPVRYYSAGMSVRLAFSIATAIEPDILLIDEAFAAGDYGFQEKAKQRLNQLIARSKIVVAVNHELETLRTMCDEIIWLDHGRVRARGKPAETIGAYRDHFALARVA